MGSAHTTFCEDTISAIEYSDAFSVNTDRKEMWYNPTILSYSCSTTQPGTEHPVQIYKRVVNWYFVMLVSVVGLWLLFRLAMAMTKYRGGGGGGYTAAYM